MDIVCIADTHGRHDRLRVPAGDVLVHAGDFTEVGEPGEVDLFIDWLAGLPHERKIFIGGNHEFYLEEHAAYFIEQVGSVPGLVYLQDSGTEIDGIKFWGSPVSPRYGDWAFNRSRGPEIRAHWDRIPKDTNVLVTYCPQAEIGDLNYANSHEGCADLRAAVAGLPNLRLHVFGHIHIAFGLYEQAGVAFVNAAMLTDKYALRERLPFVFKYEG
jgi:Icc-related predicted phosphoesterase